MTLQSTPQTLTYFRDNARKLLNEFDAADGLATYYTMYHEPRRTTIAIHRASDGSLDGFLTQCLTGIDLFRPLVTMRLRGAGAAARGLIAESLVPGRPYMLIVPERVMESTAPHLDVAHAERTNILRLEPARYRAEMNALIVHTEDVAGHPRVEARDGRAVLGSAGVNWRSSLFADVYVTVDPAAQRRGVGRSLVNALVGDLLKLKVTPLYTVAESHAESLALAEAVGFIDTGAREIAASVQVPVTDTDDA